MRRRYQYILFDLDGTLTDSKPGITKCVQFALESFGIREDNVDHLEKFIGPPLRQSFPEYYGFDDEQTAKAIKKYRERYNTKGVYENEIYPHMADFLKECKESGCKLAIASSKPQYLVEQVLEHFEIRRFFDVIIGALGDGVRDTKTEVMEEALRCFFPDTNRRRGKEDLRDMTKEAFPRTKVLMVGDRGFDIEGAKHFGIESLGVTYGYAPDGELKQAGADYLADSLEGMRRVILGSWQSEQQKKLPSIKKSMEILLPLCFYWLLTQLVILIAGVIIGVLNGNSQTGGQAAWIRAHSDQIAVWINGMAVVATYPFTFALFRQDRKTEMSAIVTRYNDKRMKKWSIPIFVWAGSVALGLNILLEKLAVMRHSASFAKVSSIQFSVSATVGILIFGILTPIGEELIFRGILYNRMKRYFSPLLSVVLSAFIFGIYHGNLVQFVYAFGMGICMAILYESFERISAPVFFHCGANTFVYLVTKMKTLPETLGNSTCMTICLVLTGLGICFLLKRQCLTFEIEQNVHRKR